MMSSFLEIKKIVLPVIIGIEPEEKHKEQKISFEIKIKFCELPKACFSDKIKETICYATLTEAIAELCKNNEFNLIEHLAYKTFNLIKEKFLLSGDKLTIKVSKLPPHHLIQDKCIFTIEE